jgi:multidrug efflux pump subunit AcrA (membrane-fusion protein)
MYPLTRTRFVLLLLLLTIILSGCRFGRRAPEVPEIALPSLTPEAPEMITYPVTAAGEIVQLETYSGRVIPGRQEDLFFRRSGQIAEVYVADGDQVAEGDILATLDNSVIEIDLQSALLGLAIAKENVKQATETLALRRAQAESNVEVMRLRLQGAEQRVDTSDASLTGTLLENIRKEELRQAELALQNVPTAIDPILDLNLQRAELTVERVKQQILEGQISAPFDGEIRFISLPEDDEPLAATAYNAVARVVDTSQVKVELNLTRSQLALLREGMPVTILATNLPDEGLAGVLSGLPRPFGTSQGTLTEVSLANPDDGHLLREEGTVVVEIRLQSQADALLIPRSTLQEENQIYFVTVLDGDQLRRVNVSVGLIGDDFVEVLAGLSEGNLVVEP